MAGSSVETIDHLTEVGVKQAELAAQKPTIQALDASKLTIEKTKAPRDVPELNSEEVWKMRTCSDHSKPAKGERFVLSLPNLECGRRSIY